MNTDLGVSTLDQRNPIHMVCLNNHGFRHRFQVLLGKTWYMEHFLHLWFMQKNITDAEMKEVFFNEKREQVRSTFLPWQKGG